MYKEVELFSSYGKVFLVWDYPVTITQSSFVNAGDSTSENFYSRYDRPKTKAKREPGGLPLDFYSLMLWTKNDVVLKCSTLIILWCSIRAIVLNQNEIRTYYYMFF